MEKFNDRGHEQPNRQSCLQIYIFTQNSHIGEALSEVFLYLSQDSLLDDGEQKFLDCLRKTEQKPEKMQRSCT